MVTHGDTTSTGITLLFGNAEAEIVDIALVGRDSHLENTDTLGALIVNFVIIVGILNLFEALLLGKFNFFSNGAFQKEWQGVLETELEFSAGSYD
jgi:hypothetical protein